MRAYERTHPWLKFALDLRDLTYVTWLHVGKTVSRTEQIAGAPLDPEATKQLDAMYLAKGALATTAIEGNTLTESEALDYLEGRLVLPPSRQYLGREIDNIAAACNRIGSEAAQGGFGPISPAEIQAYNKMALHNLPPDEDVVPGEVRKHAGAVGEYRGAPAEDLDFLLSRFCDWLNDLAWPKSLQQPYSILSAIAAHLYFVWIRPFGDGNGRTARLIEFRYLLAAGFPASAAHLLSDFYNLTRTEYCRQLDRAGKSGGQMSEFIAYATQGLADQLHEQLKTIRKLQWDTTWRNYVYELFGKGSAAHLRRRKLVLELSSITGDNGWVPASKIPELTPKLAQAYARKTAKTLSRDLNAVEEMNLIHRTDRSVRANKRLVLAFLPAPGN